MNDARWWAELGKIAWESALPWYKRWWMLPIENQAWVMNWIREKRGW